MRASGSLRDLPNCREQLKHRADNLLLLPNKRRRLPLGTGVSAS